MEVLFPCRAAVECVLGTAGLPFASVVIDLDHPGTGRLLAKEGSTTAEKARLNEGRGERADGCGECPWPWESRHLWPLESILHSPELSQSAWATSGVAMVLVRTHTSDRRRCPLKSARKCLPQHGEEGGEAVARRRARLRPDSCRARDEPRRSPSRLSALRHSLLFPSGFLRSGRPGVQGCRGSTCGLRQVRPRGRIRRLG